MTHPLYVEATKTTEILQETRLKEVQLASEFAQAQYKLSVIKARVERTLIKRVKEEKDLGHSVESRERVFVLARDADPDFVAQLKHVSEIQLRLELARAEILSLRDKLNVLLTSMRVESLSESRETKL